MRTEPEHPFGEAPGHTRMLLTVTTVVVALCGAIVGSVIGASHDRDRCPTEDSCTVSYYDGDYHVERVTP